MSRPIARYAITAGLAGLYMPNAHYGAHAFTTRRELAFAIRDYLAEQEFPKAAFSQAHIRRTWRFITRHGSSTAHFSITHGDMELSFHGLTEEECEEMMREDELS